MTESATTPREPLVDTHTHVVSPDPDRYPLSPRELSGTWYLDAPASAEELAAAMDASGVDRAILVQAVGAYTYDNRYAADAAQADPGHFVSACCIDAEAEDATRTLDYWIRERGMSGIRLFALAREGPSWLIDERTVPLWQRASELEANVIVTILPHQLDELETVLIRFPETPVSLDHCAFALAQADSAERLFQLSARSNLHLKVSTHVLDDAVAHEGSARPLMRRLVDAFGPDRIMWGSDFCQTHDRSYAELVQLARESFADLDTEERSACLAGTARRLWPGLA